MVQSCPLTWRHWPSRAASPAGRVFFSPPCACRPDYLPWWTTWRCRSWNKRALAPKSGHRKHHKARARPRFDREKENKIACSYIHGRCVGNLYALRVERFAYANNLRGSLKNESAATGENTHRSALMDGEAVRPTIFQPFACNVLSSAKIQYHLKFLRDAVMKKMLRLSSNYISISPWIKKFHL